MKNPLVLGSLTLLASSGPLLADKAPNFVVILSDDHTYRAIGYRNPAVKTPNMDRLAAEGFRFDCAFTASPICAASRASIYSGVFPQQNGSVGLSRPGFLKSVVEEKRFATLPAVLEKAGYHTALYGKSHLGEPTTFGFTEGRELNDVNDDETFAEADKFLARESKSDRPFLLWLTPRNPHLPLTAPQRFKDIYKDADIKLDPNWRESPLVQSFFNQGPAGEPIAFRDNKNPVYPNAPAGCTGGPPRNETQMKEVIKAYYGDISCLDEQIGHLIDQLKANGLYENTVIIYFADNGYFLGNHGLGNKITMHEESVRVPMFIHSPLLPVKRAKSDALVSSLDVYPTILDLAGVPAPSNLMGKSLRPVLNNPAAVVRDHVVTECVGIPESRLGVGHRMVRTDRYKYILSDADEEAFFDLKNDPCEMNNLIGSPELKGEIEKH
ncbi:MAG: sulfatase-like hydrolase/transferase, partial [Kiritimatiellales bacterium]